jgi:hypothetical protein
VRNWPAGLYQVESVRHSCARAAASRKNHREDDSDNREHDYRRSRNGQSAPSGPAPRLLDQGFGILVERWRFRR